MLDYEQPKIEDSIKSFKKPYTPPRMIVHGTVEKITQVGALGGLEALSNGSL